MAPDRNPSPQRALEIDAGGPGFASDLAPVGQVEIGPARHTGTPIADGDGQLDDRALKPAIARAPTRTESRSRALFEREDSGTRGPHVLNRAFAGTYPKER